jgi:leucine dehydrogenase
VNIETHAEFTGHECVRIIADPDAKLFGVVAIHSTARGPAAGGCRLSTYPAEERVLNDALRLSRAMSFKNALADLPWGGGKAVINKPAEPFDRPALFEAFGRCVDELEGRYITAEDVGTSTADMAHVARRTRHVTGLAGTGAEVGGDPSPWTAEGVRNALRAALGRRAGEPLSDLRIAIQGVGHVGGVLAQLLSESGAHLVLTDVDEDRLAEVAGRLGAETVAPDSIYEVDADVFMPCALGAVLNDETIPRLKASLVVGAANNQLANDEAAEALDRAGIVYVPDYVINSGGIICCAAEHHGWARADVARRIHRIGELTSEILLEAIRTNRRPLAVANARAEQVIADATRSRRG